MLAVLQAILGIRVRWQHLERLPKQQHVMVSNHVSTGDMMALYSLPQSYVHLVSSSLPHRVAMVSGALPNLQKKLSRAVLTEYAMLCRQSTIVWTCKLLRKTCMTSWPRVERRKKTSICSQVSLL